MSIEISNSTQSITQKIATLLSETSISLANPGKLMNNHGGSHITNELVRGDSSLSSRDEDEHKQNSNAAENVPLEYIYLLYRL